MTESSKSPAAEGKPFLGSPRIRRSRPFISYTDQGPRAAARSYAFDFAGARPALRNFALGVAGYLGLPKAVILSTWRDLDEMRQRGKRRAT